MTLLDESDDKISDYWNLREFFHVISHDSQRISYAGDKNHKWK